jgi:hypothetical protein
VPWRPPSGTSCSRARGVPASCAGETAPGPIWTGWVPNRFQGPWPTPLRGRVGRMDRGCSLAGGTPRRRERHPDCSRGAVPSGASPRPDVVPRLSGPPT